MYVQVGNRVAVNLVVEFNRSRDLLNYFDTRCRSRINRQASSALRSYSSTAWRFRTRQQYPRIGLLGLLVRYVAFSSATLPNGLPDRQIGHASPLQRAFHSVLFHLLIIL